MRINYVLSKYTSDGKSRTSNPYQLTPMWGLAWSLSLLHLTAYYCLCEHPYPSMNCDKCELGLFTFIILEPSVEPGFQQLTKYLLISGSQSHLQSRDDDNNS